MSVEKSPSSYDVEVAEFARMSGGVVLAAEWAAMGLGLGAEPLTEERITEIAEDPEQRAVFACLARIHVDASKTLANQAKLPHDAVPPLEAAAKTIETVYRNSQFQQALQSVSEDHQGRRHHFIPEMKRDEAKTLFAASVLYSPKEARSLIELGEQLLTDTHASLPDSHPTKPLLGIELELSRAARGEKIDTKALLQNFERLVDTDLKNNPQRVAIVASWLIAWGEKISDEALRSRGMRVFIEITSQHREWQGLPDTEREKIKKQRVRQLLFRLLTPVTTSAVRREALKAKLSGSSTQTL